MDDQGFVLAQATYEHAEPPDDHCPICEDTRQVRILWGAGYLREDDGSTEFILDSALPDIFIPCPECQGVGDTYRTISRDEAAVLLKGDVADADA
jgi:hypothetical protein